jgi:glutathione S-transferase
MAQFKLWGFDGSTYVRTVKMVFAEKGSTDFEQVQINVLAGDPKTPEHMKRHPFAKVPVLDHGSFRIIETAAISRYLNAVLPGASLVPNEPKDQARMDMVTGIVDSYGYGALLGGVAAYHLFPDFVGGKNDASRSAGVETGRKVVDFAMQTKGSDPFIAGANISLADLYLAPILFYVSLTPDFADVTSAQGFGPWWDSVQARRSFAATQPNLG